MKTIKILLICMFAVVYVSAQNVPPYTIAETEVNQPKFMAVKMANNTVENSLHNYIAQNFKYPTSEVNHEGTEVVHFVIDATGEVSNFTIVNSVSAKIDNEILRVLEGTDNMWIPGQTNGVPVAMEKEIAIKIVSSIASADPAHKDFAEIARTYYTKGSEKLLLEHKSKQALRNFDKGIKYKPYDQSLLYLRGLCLYELGKTDEAHQDWARVKKLGGYNMNDSYFAEDIKKLKGYHEIAAMLDLEE
ncbi:energy transducer TonB [uncultured Draconibacterium sp.]|uniref:energy transducer TonB n=1 Tax=uncultured Draconibacterium sp. TaxID=1573823 RepID=UPI0032162E41